MAYGDTISRQAAITQLSHNKNKGDDEWELAVENDIQTIWKLPPAQQEPLTDREQRIFLAAMGREENVCRKVDEEWRNCVEAYEDSLVWICKEIVRKVKGALWQT